MKISLVENNALSRFVNPKTCLLFLLWNRSFFFASINVQQRFIFAQNLHYLRL